jgi:uncharacterized protein with gpF-like domain
MADEQAMSEQRRRRGETAALALLAIGTSLPALVRAAKVKPWPFRRIQPTEALRSQMAAPYFTIAAEWAAERDSLVAGYAHARASGDAGAINRAIAAAHDRVSAKAAAARAQASASIRRLDAWHARQWAQRVRTATRVDLGAVIPADTSFTTGNAAHWAEQLIDDMIQQTGNAIGSALQATLAANAQASDAVAAVVGVVKRVRRRAANIGADQTDRISSQLDRDRRKAVGITKFRWHHSPHVRQPRPEHLARDGRIYSEANAPNDRAGTLYGCQCWEEPLLLSA